MATDTQTKFSSDSFTPSHVNTKTRPLALLGLSLASLAVVMELPMIFTILPNIELGIAPTLAYLHWIMVIYILMVSVSLVTIWRLSDFLGRRWVLYIGLFIFGFSSLLCGFAQSSGALILFRAFEGIGAAMILPNTISLLKSMYHEKYRSRAIGMWVGFNIVGFVIGPVIGGIFAVSFGWPSVFYLLTILSAISLFLCSFSVKESFGSSSSGSASGILFDGSMNKELNESVDIFGGVIFSIFLVFLVVAIVQGPTWGWGSLLSVLFFIVAAVAGIAFASQQWRLRTPVIDLNMLKNRFYRASMFASVAIATYLYGGFFIMPAYLHVMQSLPVDIVGFLILAVTIVACGVQPLARSLTRVFNHKLLLLFGLFLMIVSTALQANFREPEDLRAILFGFIFMGFGLGIVWSICRMIVRDLFKNHDKTHLATETLWTWQCASATIGLAIMGVVFRQSQQNQLALILSEQKVNLSLYQNKILSNYLQTKEQIHSLFVNKGVILNQALADKVVSIYQLSFDNAYVRSMEFALGLCLAAFIAIVVIKMVRD